MTSFFLYSSVAVVTVGIMCKKNEVDRAGSIFVVIVLAIFAGCRYSVGTDFRTYIWIWQRISGYTWKEFFGSLGFAEWAFQLATRLTYMIGGRVLSFGLLSGAFVVFVILALKENYANISWSVSLFVFLFAYYFPSFNITRQFLAVGIVFWGLKFVYEDKGWAFLFVIIIATGVHTSALLGLALWFLWDHSSHSPIRNKLMVPILGFATFVVSCYRPIGKLICYRFEWFNARYSSYFEINSRGHNRDFYLYLFEFIIILVFSKKLIRIDEKNKYMFMLLIVSLLWDFLGFYNPTIKRASLYFSLPARMVLLGYLPQCFKVKDRTIVKVVICGYMMTIFYITAVVLGQGDIVPYCFDVISP